MSNTDAAIAHADGQGVGEANMQTENSPIASLDFAKIKGLETRDLAAVYSAVSALEELADAKACLPVYGGFENPGAALLLDFACQLTDLKSAIGAELGARPTPPADSLAHHWRRQALFDHALAHGCTSDELAQLAKSLDA